MNLVFPDSRPETFYINPKDVDSVWFVFIPTHPQDKEMVFLCSFVFFKDNVDEVRVEPRYFNPDLFNEFLKNTELNSVYKLLIRLTERAESVSLLKSQLQNLHNQEFICIEIRTPKDISNPLELNDYTTCALYCYEPKTLTNISDSLINKLINELNKMLEPNYSISNDITKEITENDFVNEPVIEEVG